MKSLLTLLTLFLAGNLIASELTPEQKDVKVKTELFWSFVESKEFDKAGKYIFESKEKEYESLTIAWVITKSSGWKIIEL